MIMMMLALMGEVRFSPWKNISWLAATPSSPHRAILGRSFLSGQFHLALLRSRRNRKLAPSTRINIKAEGSIHMGITSFAQM